MPGMTSQKQPVHRTFGKSKMRSFVSSQTKNSFACASAFKKLLSRARRAEKACLKAIAAASIAGRTRKARIALNFYLESYNCKIVAIYEANRRLKLLRRLPEGSIAEEAKSLSLRHSCDEPVHVFTKWKRSGGFRFIYNFGPRNRARQLMVAKGLKALHGDLLQGQYAINGGRDACVMKLLQRIATNKTSCVAEIDIRNFFGSIDPLKLRKEIGLSEDHLRYVVACGSYNISNMVCPLNAALKCRNGIPQGSLCSPIIAAIVVSRVLKSTDLSDVTSYADNICLVGNDEESVRVQRKTLITALNGSPFGTLGVHLRGQSTSVIGINFLGYHIKVNTTEVDIEASDEVVTAMFQKLLNIAKQNRGRGKRRSGVLHLLDDVIDRWLPGFALSSSDRNTFMLRRFVEYISTKPIKGLTIDEVGLRFDRWNEKLSKSLDYRAAHGGQRSISFKPSTRDER